MPALPKTGFIPVSEVETKKFLSPEHMWFIPRTAAETNEDYKQIIPYLVLRYKDQVAIYRRTSNGAESRLHNLYSLGFGGHVGVKDAVVAKDEALDVQMTLTFAATRELKEEVIYGTIARTELTGVIYSDADAVSRVHLGLVQTVHLVKPFVCPAENALCEIKFVPIAELAQYINQMETWSALVAKELLEEAE